MTISQIAGQMGVTERSVYRYVDTFKRAGFVIKSLHGGVYCLERMPDDMAPINTFMYFTEEEAYLLNRALDTIVPTNALRRGLREKLAVLYHSTGIAAYTDQHSNAIHIETLKKAIKERKKVILKNYESANSDSIRDRIVEPFNFSTDYIEVIAFDTEDCKNKIFKIHRIDEVVLLDQDWQYEPQHKNPCRDIFGMSGDVIDHIVLMLSIRAKNLLVEEHPIAEKYLSRDGTHWILEADVCSYLGVGRFCAGLCEDVSVIGSEKFRQYMYELLLIGHNKFARQK